MALFLALAALATAQSIPYTPTRVFTSSCGRNDNDNNDCSGADLAYILTGGSLLSYNYSSSSIDLEVVTDTLPFNSTDEETYNAVRTSAGLTVYGGTCGSTNGQMWTFTTKWEQVTLMNDGNGYGPWFLGGMIAQESDSANDTTLYAYGGMCGSSQSAGEYTKTMLSEGCRSSGI